MNKNYIISSFLLSLSCPTAIEGNTSPAIIGNGFCPEFSEIIPKTSDLFSIGNGKPFYMPLEEMRGVLKAYALKNRISEISCLNYDWNGEGAVVPSEEVVKNAFNFLDCILSSNYINYVKPEDIVPTPYGTIDLDFETREGLVSVEIGKNRIGFFTEYTTKEDLLSDGILTDFMSIPQILQQALYNLEDYRDTNAISA